MATTDRPAGPSLAAVVLAGGRASRMAGEDKGLLPLAGRPLIEWVIDRLRPQVGAMVISANRNLDRYAAFGLPVVPDLAPDRPGPLAGILAAARQCDADWLLAVPCDVPFLPADLAARMLAAAGARAVPLVRAADPAQVHYAVMLLRRDLLADMADYLADGGRRVQAWQARHAHAEAAFASPQDFLNVNDAADLARAESVAAAATTVDKA